MRMPSKRLAATAGVLIVLAAGFGSAVSAQSEGPLDPMGANYWTGTWTYIEDSFVQGEETPGPEYTESLGSITSGDVTADDPRMVGMMTQVQNVYFSSSREPGEGSVAFANGTARIDNDEGAWVGTWTAYGSEPGSEEWYVMEGEGAYDGLTTVFRFLGGSLQGVIQPAELPPLPDPVAPTAE